MKKYYTLIRTLAFAVILTGCGKIEPETSSEPKESPREWKVSIQASTSNGTKALSESGNTISAAWEAGDVVYICNSSNTFGQMTAESSGTVTTLSGTVTKTMTAGKTYTLRYLQKGENLLNLRSQKGTLADLAKNHDMAEATVTVKNVNGTEVVFEENTVNFESKISIVKFTFDRVINYVSVICSNLKTYVRPGYSSNYSFIEVNPEEATQNVYVAMSTLEAQKSIFLFLAKDANGFYYIAAKRAQVENGKNYGVNVSLRSMPDYVDLGIVRDGKSVCWGTKNLGASSPGEAGNYYAWAETSTKTSYSWDNYAYGSYSWITKYDPDRPDQGVVDGLASLLPEDDAATSALGEKWRTPSLNDFNDLLNSANTEAILSGAYGRWGYTFLSKIDGYTGRFIFLPVGGYYKDDTRQDGGNGYYWSRQIDQTSWTSSSFANTFKFSNSIYSSPSTSRMERAYGLSVRPVYIQ